jgi:hypothetical protein
VGMATPARESETWVRLLAQPLEAAIAGLAATQHCVVELAQLQALGLGARAVQARAAEGRLHRRFRGVYSIVPLNLLTREGHWMAAVLACGDGAALSHVSAAVLHGLRDSPGYAIDVTIPPGGQRRHQGVRIRRSSTLADTDLDVVDGIPCTSVARTMLDIADVLTRRGVERAFDQMEINQGFDLLAIHDQLTRNPTRPGVKVIRAVLAEHYIGRTPTWNEFEEAMFAISRSASLPDPELNQWLLLHDGGPPIKADFMWRAQRVVVETDGYRFHGTRQAFERDRNRDQRLTVANWRPIRTTWRQVFNRPGELRSRLIRLVNGTRGAPG